MNTLLTYQFLGNPLLNWLIAAGIFLLVFLALVFLKNKALGRARRLAAQTRTRIDDILIDLIGQTRIYALLTLALYLASLVLVLTPNATIFLRTGMFMLLLVQMAVWASRLITLVINHEVRRRVGHDDQSSTTVSLIGFFARAALWTIVALVLLDNLPNVQVTSLVASLGISGVAVAIAVQNILRDLFASLSIALDKPFVIGDFIIVDQHQGTVENIGLKSTRIRSLFGEQIIISNSDLLSSRIKNYKRMVDRRVTFTLKLDKHTPHEQLTRVPVILQEIIQMQSPVRFGRAHLHSIGDSALLYEVVYHVLSPDYDVYMDVQQNVNLAILNRFAAEGISIAFT